MTTTSNDNAAQPNLEMAAAETGAQPQVASNDAAPVQAEAANQPAAASAKKGAAKAKGSPAKKTPASKGGGAKKAPSKRSGGRKPAVTLKDIGDGYIRHLQEKEASPGTLFSYQMELKLAADELGEETSAKKLTAKLIEEFFESDRVTKKRGGKPKAQPSIDKTRRVLRQALLWAEESGLIEKAPVQKLVRKNARTSS